MAEDRTIETATPGAPSQPAPLVRLEPDNAEPPAPTQPAVQLPIPAKKPPDEALLAGRTDLDPERLIGLSLVETEALLGEPALQDEKPPAKVWTYNGHSCVLSIFFYADISTKDFRALTYEIRKEEAANHEEAPPSEEQVATTGGERPESQVADRQCLAELMKEHAT